MSGIPVEGIVADSNGAPVTQARIISKKKGTSTDQALYEDEALTTPASNPYNINNSAGFYVLYRNPLLDYSIEIKSADEATTYNSFILNGGGSGVSSSTDPNIIVSNLAGLQALIGGDGEDVVEVLGRSAAGDGYYGRFRWVSGDQSANVSSDTLQGIWVAPTVDSTGASGAWQRIYEGPARLEWFAAITGTDDSAAMNAALLASLHVELDNDTVYAFKDIDVTRSFQTIECNNALIRPAADAQYVLKMDGYRSTLRNVYMDDLSGAVVRQTTLSAGASTSATSLTVTSGTGFTVGQRISIQLDTLYYFSTWVTAVSGTTITINDGLPSAAASGNTVWASFGLVWHANAYSVIEGFFTTNAWAGLLIDDGSLSSQSDQPGIGSISRVVINGARQFGILHRRNANSMKYSDIHMTGGYSQTETFTGDGSTTDFDLEYPVHLYADVTVTVGGVTQTLTTDYTIPSSPGNRISFVSAPADGAAISVAHFRDGVDVGFLDDPRTSTVAFGGNMIGDMVVLNFNTGVRFKDSELWNIDKLITDTCDGVALEFDGGDYFGTINQLFVGFAPILVNVKNTSTGWTIQSLETNRTTLASQVGASVSTQFAIESGSTIKLNQMNWVGDRVASDAFTGAGYPTFLSVEYLHFNSRTSISSGTTTFLGIGEHSTTEGVVTYQMYREGYCYGLAVYSNAAPGASETIDATFRKSSVDTALTLQFGGASEFGDTAEGGVAFASTDQLAVEVVTSASAASARLRGALRVAYFPNS